MASTRMCDASFFSPATRFESWKLTRALLATFHATAKPKKFEDAIDDVVAFAKERSHTFPFTFIDPTGWSGFALDVIRPVLELEPGEVLINFMTHHIRRFIGLEETQKSFREMFGRDIRPDLEGLEAQEREEKLVGAYIRSVKAAGRFTYVGSAIILKPEVETTHFHLIYATRNDRGVEVFKQVEQKLMDVAEQVRAEAKERKRLTVTGQTSLLTPTQLHVPDRTRRLRDRYLEMARHRVRERLQKHAQLPYASLWRGALAFPLVWEKDLRAWIDEWRSDGLLDIPTQKGTKRRVPSRELDTVVWRG